jgi:hypothetical protein
MTCVRSQLEIEAAKFRETIFQVQNLKHEPAGIKRERQKSKRVTASLDNPLTRRTPQSRCAAARPRPRPRLYSREIQLEGETPMATAPFDAPEMVAFIEKVARDYAEEFHRAALVEYPNVMVRLICPRCGRRD